MSEDDSGQDDPTRRECVKYGGAVIGGGLLAGCSSDGDPDSSPTRTTTTATESPPEPETSTSQDTETSTPADRSYSVTMSPAGTVEFEQPPENVYTLMQHHTGMVEALGHGEALNTVFAPEYYDTLWNRFYERLPGVSVDWADFPNSWNAGKELLYDLDSDLHLADPAFMTTMDAWERRDVEEVRENVAPWFGNTFSDGNRAPPEYWADHYEHYTLWEIFERVAQVFQEQKRYEALAAIHADILSTIETNLPPEDERPTAAIGILVPAKKYVWVYQLNGPGFFRSHTRPLGAVGAFEEMDMEFSQTVDYEALVEADPDVLLCLGGMSQDNGMNDFRQQLRDNDTAAVVSAVENGRVYAQGSRIQGPIVNLFQLEMTAKQLYPDQFGPWPTYDAGPYPEIPEDERLFDRQRVADVISGDF